MNEFLPSFFDSLGTNTIVTHLNLSYCNLTDDTIVLVAKMLETNVSIICLQLHGNIFRDFGPIGRALQVNGRLTALRVGKIVYTSCVRGDIGNDPVRGAEDFYKGIANCMNLRELNIDGMM